MRIIEVVFGEEDIEGKNLSNAFVYGSTPGMDWFKDMTRDGMEPAVVLRHLREYARLNPLDRDNYITKVEDIFYTEKCIARWLLADLSE